MSLQEFIDIYACSSYTTCMLTPVYNLMSILIMISMLVNYQIGYRYLRVETKRSWGSLNVNGGYWNILRISLNQVDNETI